jgi:hypothetical protein
MTDNHITVRSIDDAGGERICTYAVSEEIFRDLREANRKTKWWQRKLTGMKLQNWLEKNGCKLDNPDGPAYVFHGANGLTQERYYRNGKQHREDGPARITRNPDGSTEEEYYRDDKRHRADGPAYVKRLGNVSIEEYYCLDGVMCGKYELEIRHELETRGSLRNFGFPVAATERPAAQKAENNQNRQVHGVSPPRCEEVVQDCGGLKRGGPDPIRAIGNPTIALNQKKLPSIKM